MEAMIGIEAPNLSEIHQLKGARCHDGSIVHVDQPKYSSIGAPELSEHGVDEGDPTITMGYQSPMGWNCFKNRSRALL